MALNDFFVWGDGGAQLTPEQIARRKEIESAILAKQGIDVSPVASWTQGAARVADAIAGAFRRGSLDRAEKANTAYNSDLLSGLLSNNSGGTPASSGIPMSDAASEVKASNPAGAPIDASTDIAAYIKDAATARGIDPQIALRVAKSEGGFGNPVQQSYAIRKDGSRETSYGPFQLLIGGGLGDQALKAGIDPRDPNQWKQGVDFALDQVRKGGWAPWYGAQKQGITGMMGVGDLPTSAPAKPVETASIQPQTASDAITAYAPASGGLSAKLAPALPAPTTVAPPPAVASVPSAAPSPINEVGVLESGNSVRPPTFATSAQVAQDMSGPVLANAMKVLSDPRANANTKAIAEILVRQGQARQQAILEQQLKQSDPGYQADLRLKNLQADQIANPRISPTDQANIDISRDKFKFEKEQGALTPGIKEYNAYAADEIKAGRQPVSRLDYEIAIRKSGATNTTINNGESNKFYNTLDENNAKIFSNLSDAGIQGRSKLGQIDQLGSLLQTTGSGWATALKAKAGDFGINTEGLSDIQAATAMLSKMIPEQRAPGSGPVSDADLEGFRNSLPRLINQPGGNATIINTMRGLTQYQISMGEIADRVADRSITPEEGRRQIRELPNPLANFRAPEPGQESNGWSAVPTDIPGVKIRRKN